MPILAFELEICSSFAIPPLPAPGSNSVRGAVVLCHVSFLPPQHAAQWPHDIPDLEDHHRRRRRRRLRLLGVARLRWSRWHLPPAPRPRRRRRAKRRLKRRPWAAPFAPPPAKEAKPLSLSFKCLGMFFFCPSHIFLVFFVIPFYGGCPSTKKGGSCRASRKSGKQELRMYHDVSIYWDLWGFEPPSFDRILHNQKSTNLKQPITWQ